MLRLKYKRKCSATKVGSNKVILSVVYLRILIGMSKTVDEMLIGAVVCLRYGYMGLLPCWGNGMQSEGFIHRTSASVHLQRLANYI